MPAERPGGNGYRIASIADLEYFSGGSVVIPFHRHKALSDAMAGQWFPVKLQRPLVVHGRVSGVQMTDRADGHHANLHPAAFRLYRVRTFGTLFGDCKPKRLLVPTDGVLQKSEHSLPCSGTVWL